MSFSPTDEQVAILDHVRAGQRSLNADALAGAAKTTTLRLAAPLIKGQALALAFNVAIKNTLTEQLPDNFTVLTLNGLGHRAWMKTISSRIKLVDFKVSIILKPMNLMEPLKSNVRAAVNAAKAHGLVPTNHGTKLMPKSFIPDTEDGWNLLADIADLDISPEIIDLARQALAENIKQALSGQIDFADQLYMPCCFGATFPKFPRVFADEIQDFSPLNLYMLQKCVNKDSILLGVGDERQSIYAFRGADAESVPKMRAAFNMDVLQLSTTFRCAKRIVDNLHWHAPEMKAAPWAPDGEVNSLKSWGTSDILPDSAVICRNNAPLFSVGFAMLGAGIPIKFLGKGMEQGLASVIQSACERDMNTSADVIAGRIEAWRELEIAKAEAIGNESKVERINDKADTLLAIPGNSGTEILANLKKLLNADEGSIILCTGHKSKGLEFDHVYHLDHQIIGARKDMPEKAVIQENNLRYVIDSRAKQSLTYIDRKGWKK